MNDEPLREAMLRACAEARRFLGATSPNPAVGAAALDEAGEVLAVAAHRRAGEPHAEVLTLAACQEAGVLARVHTLCVTLEPCNHHGRTPPCVDAILDAGIGRVVVGVRDPNPMVKGGGIERLIAAGVEVRVGMAEAECAQLLHAFAFSSIAGAPWVTVKRAFTRTGSMIPPAGQTTFTSPASLLLAHRLRKKADAILTGSGTILADDPQFTVRHLPDHPGKRRRLAIVDRRRRVPQSYLEAARARGLDARIYDTVEAALADLHGERMRDVLVEAGPTLSDAILAGAHWCLAVDIGQSPGPGLSDEVSWRINRAMPIPFDIEFFDPEAILPV